MSKTGVPWTDAEREAWMKSEEVQKNIKLFAARSRLPKTDQQKEKMSAAKLGITKSEDHKSKMSQTQKRRQELKKHILTVNPNMPLVEVWEKVKELL